jgi:CcmD family protein
VTRKQLTSVVMIVLLLAVASLAWAQQPPSPANEGFLPLSDVPAGEQIPAISLVASAYGFVWVAFIGYVWSLASRLKKVEREIGQLEQRGH